MSAQRLPLTSLVTLLALAHPSCAYTQYKGTSCDLLGDTDVYGIGIRVSYYLSYLAVIIAIAAGNKKSIRECVKGLNVITLAVLIILIRNAATGSFAIFEWLLVFPMVLLPSAGVVFLLSWETSVLVGCFGATYGLFSVLQPWLYWRLLDQGANPACDPKWFIFAYFDLYNPTWVRFVKAMSIITCIFGVFLMLLSGAAVVYGMVTPAEKLKEKDEKRGAAAAPLEFLMRDGAAENGGGAHGAQDEETKKMVKMAMVVSRIITSVCLSFTGIISIVFTEKILAGNHVDLSDASFDSTSQLIPFLVGLFTLLSTIYSSIKDRD